MQWLDELAALIRSPFRWLGKKVGVYKAHSDYYGSQKDACKYWQEPSIRVWIGPENNDELTQCVEEWETTLGECGIRVIYAMGSASSADIVITIDNTVSRGGVTHRNFAKSDPRQITWAMVKISPKEKGKRLTQIALHEVGHALGLEHAGTSDDDAMNERVYTDKLSSADRETLRKVYANRPKV
jgi:predicted Zn-dependent protease